MGRRTLKSRDVRRDSLLERPSSESRSLSTICSAAHRKESTATRQVLRSASCSVSRIGQPEKAYRSRVSSSTLRSVSSRTAHSTVSSFAFRDDTPRSAKYLLRSGVCSSVSVGHADGTTKRRTVCVSSLAAEGSGMPKRHAVSDSLGRLTRNSADVPDPSREPVAYACHHPGDPLAIFYSPPCSHADFIRPRLQTGASRRQENPDRI